MPSPEYAVEDMAFHSFLAFDELLYRSNQITSVSIEQDRY